MKNRWVFAAALVLFVLGCGGHNATLAPQPASAPDSISAGALGDVTTDATGTLIVGMRRNGEASIIDPRYGLILGYFKGRTSTTSQVVRLPMGRNVRFIDEDNFAQHTASFLGDATATSAPWPSTFTGSGAPSPAGTAIGTTNFSTGVLAFGQKSKLYTTGSPGFYMFGDFFEYVSETMRTVIIIH